MKRLADFRKQVIEGWTVQRIAAVLIVIGLIVFAFGAVTQYCACVGWPNLGDMLNHMIGDFYANVSVDCLSVAFAILVIDRLNERRAEWDLKAQLIREMGSTDNGIALRSVRELRAHGWLGDVPEITIITTGAMFHVITVRAVISALAKPPSMGHIRRVERSFAACLAFILVLYCIYQFLLYGMQFIQWDLLFISQTITFIVGMQLLQYIPRNMDSTLSRLRDRSAIQASEEILDSFKLHLESQSELLAHKNGIFVCSIIFIGDIIAFGLRMFRTSSLLKAPISPSEFQVVLQFFAPILPFIEISKPIILTLVTTVGGYVLGNYLGRMVAYGRLGTLLKEDGLPLKVQPGHLDGVAGFKPVGVFYFLQAMIAAIPAFFLAIWWILFAFLPRYEEWRETYLGLLGVMLAFEILVFLVPMWSFHQEMKRQKSELLAKADQLSQDIAQLQMRLSEMLDEQQYEASKNRLGHLIEQYWAIERMPTWPIDLQTRRRFILNNIALFIPIFSEFIGLTGVWKALAESIGKILQF